MDGVSEDTNETDLNFTNEKTVEDFDSQIEGSRHPAPQLTDEGWLIPNPIGNRLWQKSAIGTPSEKGIIVQPSELIFCNKHRSISLPDKGWVNNELNIDKDFLHESKALNEIRKSGEMLILMLNEHNLKEHNAETETWAVRWNRGEHPNKFPAISEMRWVQNDKMINWKSLSSWIINVRSKNRFAEIMVIDEEFDVTAYRLDVPHITGTFLNEDIDFIISNEIGPIWDERISSGTGNWINILQEKWSLSQIGVRRENGIWLNEIESKWIEWKLFQNESGKLTTLFNQLINSGLLLRPGFKYGCKWRIYSEDIEKQHAPWLLVPDYDAPADWNAACLAARLSAGVNKKWICAINEDTTWRYISLDRWSPGKD